MPSILCLMLPHAHASCSATPRCHLFKSLVTVRHCRLPFAEALDSAETHVLHEGFADIPRGRAQQVEKLAALHRVQSLRNLRSDSKGKET